MKEIIRKAVSYADGWKFRGGRRFIPPPDSGLGANYLDQVGVGIRDALAAQLRRQINAMEDCEVVVDKRHVTAYNVATPIQAFGPDETESSLRACVEFYDLQDKTGNETNDRS